MTKMRLTDRFEGDYITIDGFNYELDFSFDNILRIYELKEDNTINDRDKIEIMFDMLIIDCDINLNIKQKSDIIEYILNKLLSKDNIEENNINEDNQEKPKKEYDFIIDAELIYASFLFDYNIDLIDMQDKLHWNKFIALFNSLSDKTPFIKIVQIRVMEIPAPNKYNQKERQKIIRLKQQYSLEKNNINRSLDKAANFLRGGIKKKRK